jgi:hypothetical protein
MSAGLTQFLAVYGAVLSSVAVAHSVYVGWLDRRPRLRLAFDEDNTSAGGQYTWCMTLKVANVGRSQVTLEKVEFLFQMDGEQFGSWPHPRELPHELTAGKSVVFELRSDEMARVIGCARISKTAQESPTGRVEIVPICEDATGRTYRGEAREWPDHAIDARLAELCTHP